jgi:hypothetical protein
LPLLVPESPVEDKPKIAAGVGRSSAARKDFGQLDILTEVRRVETGDWAGDGRVASWWGRVLLPRDSPVLPYKFPPVHHQARDEEESAG